MVLLNRRVDTVVFVEVFFEFPDLEHALNYYNRLLEFKRLPSLLILETLKVRQVEQYFVGLIEYSFEIHGLSFRTKILTR
jgi:hypothetical protein